MNQVEAKVTFLEYIPQDVSHPRACKLKVECEWRRIRRKTTRYRKFHVRSCLGGLTKESGSVYVVADVGTRWNLCRNHRPLIDHLCHATTISYRNLQFRASFLLRTARDDDDDVELACHSKDPRKMVGSKDLRKNFHFLSTMREKKIKRKMRGNVRQGERSGLEKNEVFVGLQIIVSFRVGQKSGPKVAFYHVRAEVMSSRNL